MSKTRLLRIVVSLGSLIVFSGVAPAQSSGTQGTPDNPSQTQPNNAQNGSGNTAQNPPSNNAQNPPQNPPSNNSSQNKKEKKKKKDKPQDVMNSEVFSDAVARNVLADIRDGLEGHSPRLMESAFDQDKMDGYLTFEDQLEAMFQRYSEFRVHFSMAQNTVEGSKGVILVDIEMEEVPNSTGNMNPPPQRKSGQVRFELERGKKGWKIVDFSPRSFFS